MKAVLQIIILVFAAGVVSAQTPAAIERQLLGHLENISKYGNYGGSTDDEKLTKNNADLKAKLMKYGTRAAVLGYAFAKLKEKMYVVTSRDGRFRIYSWDRETGGTMHDFDNVYAYRGKSGKIYTWSENSDDESAGVFYHQLFQTDAEGGPIYLGISTFIGSTSLAGQSIRAFQIEGEKLNNDARVIRTRSGLKSSVGFGYDFFSVVDHPERPIRLFAYDNGKKSFRFPVVIEDSKTPQGRVTEKFITYRFNGKHFVRVTK